MSTDTDMYLAIGLIAFAAVLGVFAVVVTLWPNKIQTGDLEQVRFRNMENDDA